MQSSSAPSLCAFVTLVTSDAYLAGALVAVHSLLDAEGPSPAVPFETVCLVTPATVSVETIRALRQAFGLVVGVEGIRTHSTKELNLLGRQDLGWALSKIHLWRLVQFRKVIYLDADVLVLRPLSHLFDLDVPFAAAPDQGWPDCFNTGVMVCSPDSATFDAIMDLNGRKGSWDGADQGLLNDFFEDAWHRLPFTYNTTPSAYYQFRPAYRRHGANISVVHFIGLDKPWHRLNRSRHVATTSEQAEHEYFGLLHKWFDVYERHFGQLPTTSVASAPRPATTTSAFVVPTLAAAWDAPGGSKLAYHPPSLDKLKTMFGGAASNLGSTLASRDAPEGLYASMPLTGRPDLLHPVEPPPPTSRPTYVPTRPAPPPPKGVQPATQHQSAQPTGVVWNAQSGPPPVSHGPDSWQMRQPMEHFYENVWDARSQDSGGFFPLPQYAPLPDSVRGHYQSTPSNPSAVKQVFPWEATNMRRPTRVFPDQQAQRAPSPVAAVGQRAASPQNIDPSQPTLQYTNAWDAISGIRRYAEAMRRPSQSESRGPLLSAMSNERHTSPPSRGHNRRQSQDVAPGGQQHTRRNSDYEPRGEASSQDGDDEDDEDDEPLVASSPHKKPSRRPSAPQPLPSGPPRPASAVRPRLQRDNSLGSASRVPTVAGVQSLVDGSNAAGHASSSTEVPSDVTLTAADVKRSSHLSAARKTSPLQHTTPTSTTSAPRDPPSRIFDPQTSSDKFRREGLESLQRFVKSMEGRGEAALQSSNGSASSARSIG